VIFRISLLTFTSLLSQDDISHLFMKTKPEERTARRRQKLLFDHQEIEKIFPSQDSHHEVT
jgi:tmRNA-binding protein